MKHPMIATKAFPYARRVLKVDEEFEALSDKDALILEGLGKARRVAGAIETRDFKASDSDDDKPERTNRRYGRRDLQAEG